MHKEIHLLLGELAKVISGKEHVMQKIIMAILADGHILLDDMPGMGKTTLAVALGKVTGLTARRIQLTPDVLPSDIVGYSVYDKTTGQMAYRPGVVMDTNLLLADEINRTSSKTQSAFLEAMEERQVTVDGTTHPLQDPFVVIATQNQVGTAGTQLLPYAQLDRFMVGLSMGYPDRAAQMELLKRRQNAEPMDTLCQTLTLQRVQAMQQEVQAVLAKDSILAYITDLTMASRQNALMQVGLSPRAALHLDRMAKARAYMMERDYVIPQDVQAVFADVANHRIILSAQARMNGVTVQQALTAVLDSVPAPDWK
ncbi:MAG: AAA family ATPase [Aristaeellaceae bacterium]